MYYMSDNRELISIIVCTIGYDCEGQQIQSSKNRKYVTKQKSGVWSNIIDRRSAGGCFLLFSITFLYTDHLDYLSHNCCPHTDLR